MFTQSVNGPNEEDAEWTSVPDVSDYSVGPRPRQETVVGINKTRCLNGFEELSQCRDNSSTETFPDWERLSDSGDFYDEERCHSLPICMEGENVRHFQRSNTVWYKQLGASSENKDVTFKNKVLSAWTNVTNGWVLKAPTGFRFNSEICLLGKKYLLPRKEPDKVKRVILDELKLDFTTRIWFTYRMDFPCLPGSHLISDVGWGCMLRSGQMMLAQAFVVHFLGRDWRKTSDYSKKTIHQQIIRYFGDCFCDDCPFSIHKLVGFGHMLGRETGDWFGPASICVALREALEQARHSGHLSQLVIYLTLDCTVYKQDVIDLCTGEETLSPSVNSSLPPVTMTTVAPAPSPLESPPTTGIQPFSRPENASDTVTKSFVNDISLVNSCRGQNSVKSSEDLWRSVIILMPLRLGSETLNEVYIPCIKKLLDNDLCIGIIGGRPKHSLYFIGWQDDRLIHLDPHYCQKAVNVLKEDFATETFHCLFPRKLSFTKMDPTCAIGFYCKTRQDFERLVTELPKAIDQPALKNSPMFSFVEGNRSDIEQGCLYSMDTF